MISSPESCSRSSVRRVCGVHCSVVSSCSLRSLSMSRSMSRRSPSSGVISGAGAGASAGAAGLARDISARSMSRTLAIQPRRLRCAISTVIAVTIRPVSRNTPITQVRASALRRRTKFMS